LPDSIIHSAFQFIKPTYLQQEGFKNLLLAQTNWGVEAVLSACIRGLYLYREYRLKTPIKTIIDKAHGYHFKSCQIEFTYIAQ
jgi:hypothetical protein